MNIVSKNPSKNYEIIGEVEETTNDEILKKLNISHAVQKEWDDLGLEKRIELMRQLHGSFEEKLEDIATLISLEMGMPINQSKEEVESGLNYLEWYLDNAEKYLSPEITFENDVEIHKVFYEPKGVVASITPWNYPFSNLIWQSCQNLIVGNVVINKPDENTPLVYKLLEDIINDSEIPTGVQQFIYGGKESGKFLVSQDIDMICFTGNTVTGEYLYKVAADKMIPILMELGGSAPGIVFEDADIDNVIDSIFFNRFLNCGQICDGLKRLIVHENIFDKVVDKLKNVIENQVIGEAIMEETTVGPLVNERQLNTLIDQFRDAIDKGANVICGGQMPNNLNGSYFEPTILTNIDKDMKVWKEEVFGPILPVISFNTIEEAILLANDTIYGLGGYIFTTDKEKFTKVSREIKTGMVSCNNCIYVIPNDPFGGVKKSGLGRNHGKYGFQELCNIKIIAFEKSL
jgi:NAD-dependent aldehyde dehydrogenases